MIKTLYGKITLILLGLFILLGALNLFQSLITTKLYHQEVNQRLHRALSDWLVSETFYIKEGRANVEAHQRPNGYD